MTQQQSKIKMLPLTEKQIENILSTPEFGVISDEEVQLVKEAEREFGDYLMHHEDITNHTLTMADIFGEL